MTDSRVGQSWILLKGINIMAYEILWEPEGIHKKYTGLVSGREMIESAQKIQSDRRFDEMRYVINDFSEISGHDLSVEAFLDLAASNYGAHASNPNCRIVFVTIDQGLTKMVEDTLMSPGLSSYQVVVKPTVSEARDWLERQPRQHEISSVLGFRIW